MHRTFGTLAALALLLPASGLAQEDPIALAESAAPPEVSAEATVMDMEGSVPREGTNDWTCVAMPEAPMCLDEQWMAWLDAYMNQRNRVNVTSVGMSRPDTRRPEGGRSPSGRSAWGGSPRPSPLPSAADPCARPHPPPRARTFLPARLHRPRNPAP